MPNRSESIFHQLVRDENSHTQLIYNLAKRSNDFRRIFFAHCFGKKLGEVLKGDNIHPQHHIRNCGRPDVFIETPRLSAILEVKTEPRRERTAKQLLKVPMSYWDHLNERAKTGLQAYLTFLVPANWDYRSDLKAEMNEISKTEGKKRVTVKLIYWSEVLDVFSRNQIENPLVNEFCSHIEERFGSIKFSTTELKVMSESSFPRTAVQLIGLIEEVRRRAAKASRQLELKGPKLEAYKDEVGFALQKRKGGFRLWFGCWPDFSEDQGCTLCFGIEGGSPRQVEQFARAFREEFGGEAVPFLDHKWMMGWLPQEKIKSPNVDEIWRAIKDIWNAASRS